MVWPRRIWRNGGPEFRKFPRKSAARWPIRSQANRNVSTGHPAVVVVAAVADAGVVALPGSPEAGCLNGFVVPRLCRGRQQPGRPVRAGPARLRKAGRALQDSRRPDFADAAVGLLTQREPLALLEKLRKVEAALGRPEPEKRQRWGPRVIDLDVLVYGRERLNEPELTVPHPGIVERNFVLYPLADIAPDLEIPGLGRVTELKGRAPPAGLRRADVRSA